MLLFHASVVFGATAARRAGLLHDLVAGSRSPAQFSASRSLLPIWRGAALRASALFAGAAPAGGSLMLGGWLVLALSALFAPRN